MHAVKISSAHVSVLTWVSQRQGTERWNGGIGHTHTHTIWHQHENGTDGKVIAWTLVKPYIGWHDTYTHTPYGINMKMAQTAK